MVSGPMVSCRTPTGAISLKLIWVALEGVAGIQVLGSSAQCLPATAIEAVVVGQIRSVLASAQAVAAVVQDAQRQDTPVDEAIVVMAMGNLNGGWDQLFPAERHQITNLMSERVDLVDGDEGRYQSLTEIARAEGLDIAQVSRINRLAGMSPHCVEQIVQCPGSTRAIPQKGFPALWSQQ